MLPGDWFISIMVYLTTRNFCQYNIYSVKIQQLPTFDFRFLLEPVQLILGLTMFDWPCDLLIFPAERIRILQKYIRINVLSLRNVKSFESLATANIMPCDVILNNLDKDELNNNEQFIYWVNDTVTKHCKKYKAQSWWR